jgi:zinc protease
MNLFTNLIENGIEQLEFETAIEELKNELNQSKSSTVDLYSSYLLSRLEHKVVREEKMLSNDETNKLKLKLVDEIRIEDFEKFCKDINFKSAKKWIYEFKKEGNNVDFGRIIKNYNYDSTKINTEIDSFEIKELVASTPKSGEITQKEIAIDENVHKLWLSNGSLVIMKPTKIRKNIVFVKYQTIPDSFFIPDFENYKISFYNQIPVGTDSFRMKYLSKYWNKHLLNSATNVKKKSKKGHITVLKPNLKYALEQIHFLNSPIQWNQKEFELQKERNLNFLKNRDTTLNEFEERINEAMLKKEYIENRKTNVAKIDAFTFQEYAAIHNKVTENNKFIITIVGDFEIDSIEPLIVKYIGSLQTATNTSIKPKDSVSNYNLKSETVFVKNEKDSLHYFNVTLYNKMKFDQLEDNFIFSSIAIDMISKEIKTRIREEKGKIYGANSWYIDDYKIDSFIEFHTTLKTYEPNALEVRNELKKIIDEYKNGKIKEKDFDIQKIALKNYLTSEISSNEKWADLLIKNHIEKRNLKEYLTNRIETFHFDIFQNYLKQFFTNNYEIFGEKGK